MDTFQIIISNLIGEGSQWFWSMAQFIVIAISLWFIHKQLKAQSVANMICSLQSFDLRWCSDSMINSRYTICSEYEDHKLHIGSEEESVLGFFEDLGLYLERKVFDIDIIWETYSYYIEHYWCILEPKVKEFRSTDRDSSWFSNFENLNSQVIAYSKKKNIKVSEKSCELLDKFVKGEKELLKESK